VNSRNELDKGTAAAAAAIAALAGEVDSA